MRRIDKTEILSTHYREWVERLEHDHAVHPQAGPYYYDVVMNLLYCQKGVCAYTEMIVCDPVLIDKSNWENGVYKIKKPDVRGSLEHFDPALKERKFWDWNNLFIVDFKVNIKKGSSKVDEIMKPDSPGYDPFKLLKYNKHTHRFFPNPGIGDDETRARIKRMIDVLQLNNGTVCYERKTFFNRLAMCVDVGRPFKIDRFFTANQMINIQ